MSLGFSGHAREIYETFKLRGLFLRPDAVQVVEAQLRREVDANAALRILASKVEENRRGSAADTLVSGDEVRAVLAESTRDEDDLRREASVLVPATRHPRFKYDAARRLYYYDGNSFRLHGDADVRAGLTSERLAFVQARLSRHPNFATPLPGSELPNYVAITRIDRLSVAPAGSALTLLGTLTQPEDGLLAVEDVSGRSVALDVSRADTLHGMVTVGCVVLLQGVYDADGSPPTAVAAAAAAAQNPLLMQQQGQGQGQFSRGPGLGHPARQAQGGPSSGPAYSAAAAALPPSVGGSTLSSGGAPPSVLGPLRQGASSMLEHAVPGVFRVAAVAHPPCEARDDTLRAMGIVDPLRLHDTPADAARAAAQEASREERRVTWAVLSHVHLDAPGCLDMLGDLLAGFSAARSLPAVLVLMGDFLCAPYGSRPGDRDRLCRLMASLADTLAAHPAFLASAHVVLVPGPHDPGAPGVSPHLPLLSHFCAPLLDRQRFPRLTLSTSPARLSFYTREVVLWRDEPTLKLRRCSVLPLAPGIEPSEHMARTLIEQGHLSPLPLSVQPTYWPLDHALRISPTPDALLVGESQDPYVHTHGGCCVANPGPFGDSGSFLLFRPALGRAELSAVRPAAPPA